MNALVFDTETTGLPLHPDAKPELQPKIIEFGAALVDQDYNVLETMNVLINPDQPLEAIITKITGLTDEDLQDQPPFSAFLPDIRAMFAKADAMIAHNLPFDSTLLELELERLGCTDFPWPRLKICTTQECYEEWGRRPKLLELYEEVTGEPLAQTHRALDDVMALVEVVKRKEILHAAALAS